MHFHSIPFRFLPKNKSLSILFYIIFHFFLFPSFSQFTGRHLYIFTCLHFVWRLKKNSHKPFILSSVSILFHLLRLLSLIIRRGNLVLPPSPLSLHVFRCGSLELQGINLSSPSPAPAAYLSLLPRRDRTKNAAEI